MKRLLEIEERTKKLEILITSKHFPDRLKVESMSEMRALLIEWRELLLAENKKAAKPLWPLQLED